MDKHRPAVYTAQTLKEVERTGQESEASLVYLGWASGEN
jgi:hypothetical protein